VRPVLQSLTASVMKDEVYAVIAALVQPLAVMLSAVLTVLVVVNQVEPTRLDLEAPDRRGVVNPQFPQVSIAPFSSNRQG
jgi:hypothetical protein